MKIEILQFIPAPPTNDLNSLEAKVQRAEDAIYRLYEAGHLVVFGYSGGKDSGVLTSIGLNAARRFAATGGTPRTLVTTSNTRIENPEIFEHYVKELVRMERYGRAHGFTVATKIVAPSLAATWQMKILTGRGIPSYQGASSDCSIDLKVNPARKYRKDLFKKYAKAGLPMPVTCLGTRFDESTVRKGKMLARGDHAEVPVLNKDNELILSPIAHFTEDDIFTYIGERASNLFEGYTDFEDTKRIYAHSAGTSCVVVAQAIYDDKPKSGGCGARHGCFLCQKAEDKSLEAMIAFDSRYEYARGLNRLNKFIRNIRYDWSLRHWVGRTIKGGYVEIKPDTFHPRLLRDLTRYMLQIDYDEGVRAARAREPRKFELLPLQMMIAVDAMQNLNGVAKPFQIWADRRDIYERKIRYDIPDIPETPPTPAPPTRYLHVGDRWDGDIDSPWTGLRDVYTEGLTELGHCTPDLRTLKSGEQVWDLTTDVEFDVDPESAAMIEDMELEAMIRRFDQGYTPSGIAGGYKWYASFGALILAPSQVSKHDEVLRRTAFKDRLGLTLNYDVSLLLEQSVEFKDLPPAAKQAWKPQPSVSEKVALQPPGSAEMGLFDDVVIDDEAPPAEAPGM